MNKLSTKLNLKLKKKVLNSNKKVIIDTILSKYGVQLNIDNVGFWTDLETEQFGIECDIDLSNYMSAEEMALILTFFSKKPYIKEYNVNAFDTDNMEIEYKS